MPKKRQHIKDDCVPSEWSTGKENKLLCSVETVDVLQIGLNLGEPFRALHMDYCRRCGGGRIDGIGRHLRQGRGAMKAGDGQWIRTCISGTLLASL